MCGDFLPKEIFLQWKYRRSKDGIEVIIVNHIIEELYIPSIIKTQINLVILLCLDNQGGAKYFWNFDKVSYFWGWFSDIFMGQCTIRVSVVSSICTK